MCSCPACEACARCTLWLPGCGDGRHLRSLTFDAEFTGVPAGDESHGNRAAAIATCLTAAGTGGGLVQLTARVYPTLDTEWLPALCALRRLTLTAPYGLFISSAVYRLSALQSLHLSGRVRFALDATLPASITRLFVEDMYATKLPAQVAQLPQLQRLKLRSKRSFWYNSLHQLPALTRLDATDMPYFAVAVVALTRLQHLDLPQFTYIPEGLTDLTCLVCRSGQDYNLSLLSSLSRLQICHLPGNGRRVGYNTFEPLPGGPWLQHLRWLALGIGSVLSSVAVLGAATALERLTVVGAHAYVRAYGVPLDWDSPAAAAFFEWVASHPPLRCLSVEGDTYSKVFETKGFLMHVLRLCRRRPALLVQCPGLGDEGQTLPELVECEYPF